MHDVRDRVVHYDVNVNDRVMIARVNDYLCQ